jgi:cystathionine beta-lyase/cystathionine gamma-synthase
MTELEEMRTKLMGVDRAIRKEIGARSHKVPIFQTTTWEFDDPYQMREAFRGAPLDYYSRISGANFRSLEGKIALLEHGESAQVCASGSAAIDATFFRLSKSGQVILAHKELYGGTHATLNLLREEGRIVRFVDMRYPDEVLHNISENTAIVFCETLSNPSLHVIDIEAIAAIARQAGNSFVVVDNTFATPFNQRPLMLGAHLVIDSITKYLCGHGTHFGGVVVGKKEYIDRVYPRLMMANMDPGVASQLSEYIGNFLDAMPLHNKNAKEIAYFLSAARGVKYVHYPGFAEHINHEVAVRQMRALDDGVPFGGMVSFELEGSLKETAIFVKALCGKPNALVTHAVSLGNRDSLIEVPACSTDLAGGTVPENFLRFSVGLESSDLLKADLSDALVVTFPQWF